MVLPLLVQGERWVKLVDEALLGRKVIGLFRRKGGGDEEFDLEALGKTGTAAQVLRMARLPDGNLQLLLQGLARVQIKRLIHVEPYPLAEVAIFYDQVEPSIELEGLARSALGLFQEVVNLAPYLPNELALAAANVPEPGTLADFIAANLNLKPDERQEILDTLDVVERLKKVTSFLSREKEILEIGRKAQQEMAKTQREYFLRQQLEAIRRELGEVDEREAEINELRQRLEEANLPEEARKEAERELDRLSRMPPAAAEAVVARTYLDWVLSLPWNVSTEDNLDLGRARQVLDEDHYDLDKVKERILEYLAVRKLRPQAKGPILCFIGPPGVGKTSLGQSIARALERKFVRVALGGIRDEAEIRGHRRTYIGALPGRIIQGLRRAGSNNPVFMLDEVDKLSVGFQGDPAAALLEVLDPEQNHAFVDHYLDVPFDLSRVLFICTANVTDTIPPALLDRMEVLDLPGYTEEEKLHIARRYLVPRQIEESGLTPEQLTIEESALRRLIREYTREAGVRNLERWIGAIGRKIARRVAEGESGPFVVKAEDLDELLEPPRYRPEAPLGEDEVGVATGLAWTPTGGEVLFVEAALVPGKGHLILTGHLGEVMQESAKAALTYARSRAAELGVAEDFYEKYDVHIHVPAGAIPKDGPSAGVTIATALISALTKRPVRKRVAMTGEITLRGRILPVGGIKEKVLAAQRAGVHTVVLPEENERDLRDVPA
ncbi:MAG TPA: endopeptidase La, partial [Chloroflexi bacterium]|nr:endopeptidase La [Chloroflexota bacterium]